MIEMKIRLGNGRMFTPSIPILEFKLHTQCKLSFGSDDQCLLEIEQYEATRQIWTHLFLTSEPALRVVENNWNNNALKGEVTQLLVDCNSAQNLHATQKWFQGL